MNMQINFNDDLLTTRCRLVGICFAQLLSPVEANVFATSLNIGRTRPGGSVSAIRPSGVSGSWRQDREPSMISVQPMIWRKNSAIVGILC